MAQRFDELRVYQRARSLYIALDRIVRGPGFRGRRDLASQLLSAGDSCVANIAEGFSRRTKADVTNFFNIAVASAAEIQAHLDIAHATGACTTAEFRLAREHAEAVRVMGKAFIRGVRQSEPWKCEREPK